MSNRDQKKKVAEGVRKLRNKPGWDPATFRSEAPEQKLREMVNAEKTEKSYSASTACDECAESRKESGDETSLCPKHLSEAFGL